VLEAPIDAVLTDLLEIDRAAVLAYLGGSAVAQPVNTGALKSASAETLHAMARVKVSFFCMIPSL
jgi:hypothetical protein